MTRRAVILGLGGAAGLGGVFFYNLYVLQNTNLVGSYLPVGVFGAAVLFALGLNPLLRRIGGDRAGWSAAELGGAAAVLLFACGIVGSALLDHGTTLLMMPRHWERTRPEWAGEPAALDERSVPDPAALARALAGAGDAPAGDPARAFAERIPAETRRRAAAPGAGDDAAARDALRDALNAALADPALPGAIAPGRLPPLPDYARRWLRIEAAQRTPAQVAGLNRALLDATLPGAVAPRRPPVLDLAPPAMLADPDRDPVTALDGFVTGLGGSGAGDGFPLRRVPWWAWRRTFLFWGPLIAAMIVLVTGLSLVLHRQWAHHERLPYPTVEILHAMLPGPGRPAGGVFRDRVFWIGFGIVFALHGANYAHRWWPDAVIPVNLVVDLQPLLEIVPAFRFHYAMQLFRPTLYFTAIGLAFFLSSDAGLSLGIGPYLYSLFIGIAAGYGYVFGGGFLTMSLQGQFVAGAYAAMFLTILYTGRQYYRSVARRALGRPARDEVGAGAVGGARAAALGFAAFVALLVSVGVEPALALLYAVAAVMIFTVMSRLLAEAGVFYMHSGFFPCVLLWSFLGSRAAGYEQMLVLGLVTAMLLSDPKDALMPFVVTALRLADRSGARVPAVARWGAAAALLALVVATAAMLVVQYRDGAIKAGHPWMSGHVPRGPFDRAAAMTQALQAQGSLGDAPAVRGAARFAQAAPSPRMLLGFAVPFALVLLFTFLRHRFARWPLHPLIFLVMATYQSSLMAFSFLLGRVVKGFVMKYGGARAYQRLKPLMIGLVAGEVIAAALPLAVGAVYAAVTGEPAPSVKILPG